MAPTIALDISALVSHGRVLPAPSLLVLPEPQGWENGNLDRPTLSLMSYQVDSSAMTSQRNHPAGGYPSRAQKKHHTCLTVTVGLATRLLFGIANQPNSHEKDDQW